VNAGRRITQLIGSMQTAIEKFLDAAKNIHKDKEAAQCISPNITEDQIKSNFCRAVKVLSDGKKEIKILEIIVNSKLFSSNKKYIKSAEEEVEFLKTRKAHHIRQNIEKIQDQAEFLSMIQELDERIENEIRQINKMRDAENKKSALKAQIMRFIENLKNSDWQKFSEKMWLELCDSVKIYIDKMIFKFKNFREITIFND
jgi:hypothetical protein